MVSDKPADRDFDAEIERLKSLYRVREDQELARALGSTKAAIASWRRRRELPAWVVARVAAEFPGAGIRGKLGANTWLSLSDVYAVALAIFDNNPPPRWQGLDDDDPQNLVLRGQVFADLVEVLSSHMMVKLGETSPTALVERALADYSAGDIPGVERALLKDLRRP